MINRFKNFWSFDTLAGASLLKEGKKLGWIWAGMDAICFMLIGIAGLWVHVGGGKRALYLFLLLLTYTSPYLLAFAHPSYHLPLLPIILMAAFSQKNRPSRQKIFYFAILLILFLLIQLEWSIDLLARTKQG